MKSSSGRHRRRPCRAPRLGVRNGWRPRYHRAPRPKCDDGVCRNRLVATIDITTAVRVEKYRAEHDLPPCEEIVHRSGSKKASGLRLCIMGDDRRAMYDGWRSDGAHSKEWARIANAFLNHAFAGPARVVLCPCSPINLDYYRKDQVQEHLCNHGFMPDYMVWSKHGERKDQPIERDNGIQDRIMEPINNGGGRTPLVNLTNNINGGKKLFMFLYC
ncbi:hypothetical protein U9M48_007524 [Paspalum notatum var. saurae]|uniref:Transposase-associated domain-containing protein n=1 Tax=Paspalum notatum var. saurae TaxID=547442 RepID=A0AAQ3Q092_PASNO